MNKVGARRLLKLADILEKADALHKKRKEPGYSQDAFRHECGTPACALGHYAAANKRRWIFRGSTHDHAGGIATLKELNCSVDSGKQEFDIDFNEWMKLFDFNGCGRARTAKQAAKYIRTFVARKQQAAR